MSPLFIHPDFELNVQLVRILAILNKVSFNRKETPVLTIDKLAIFDFLLKHPFILFSILKEGKKKLVFNLTEKEINSISSEFPSNEGLFRFEDHKKLMQALIIWGYAGVTIGSSNEAFYQITQEGKAFFNEIDTGYSRRLDELAESFVSLQAETHKNLVALIIPHIHGK